LHAVIRAAWQYRSHAIIAIVVEPGGVEPLPESLSGAGGTDHNEPHSQSRLGGFFLLAPLAFIWNNVMRSILVQLIGQD
jgi:hypothetical protein